MNAEVAFHRQLLESAKSIWEATLAHPFLASVADGTIPDETFRNWLAQDYFFVRRQVPFMGVLISKAPAHLRPPLGDAVTMLNRELELFREQAEAHGASLDQEPAPTCHAYVQFMLATAYQRSFAQGFAVLYGLEKAYLDAWTWVKAHQQEESPWQAFIDNWSSDAFREYVEDWLAGTLDELANEQSAAERAAMEDLFRLTARYEYLFWDMAMSGEQWPI